MASLKQLMSSPILRTLGALLVVFAALAGATGQAFAHDSDDSDEIESYGPSACVAIADLPVYPSATCVKHSSELDDGVTETKDSYVAAGAGVTADVVRRAFEATFQAQGWSIVEAEQDAEDQQWEYTVAKPGRQVKVEVEAQEPDEGTGTAISIKAK